MGQYKERVTVGVLRKMLLELPGVAYIDIARDEELNGVSAPAVWEEDGRSRLEVYEDRMAHDGKPVFVLWPSCGRETIEERYVE